MLNIILASQSPRRRQLLEWAEIPFTIVVKPTEESFPDNIPLEEIPIYIARGKAVAVNDFLDEAYHQQHSNNTILAADTIVVLNNKVINKPHNRQEAIEMLNALSGNKHRVITGVVIKTDIEEKSFAEVTEVEFHPLSQEQIEFYVDKYAPYDKAGAYAIQEWIGVVGVKSINGDFYNVMGLPISKVLQTLQEMDPD